MFTSLFRPQIALWLFLAASTAYVGYRGLEDPHGLLRQGGDFKVFYVSGKMLVSDQRDLIFGSSQGQRIRPEFAEAVANFFNPPLFGYLYAPLGLLSLADAKSLSVALMAACAVAIVWQFRRWTRKRAELLMIALAIGSFWPAYASLLVGQPSLAFALVATVAFVALYEGRERTAGWTCALLVLKPSVALAHVGLMLYGGRPRVVTSVITGAILFGALPFAALGLTALGHYFDLLSASRNDAFYLTGRITAGAAYMFNWNGFYGRLTLTPPAPPIMFPFYLITAMVMVKVWARGLPLESWMAAALATNLAIPHVLYYDLVLLLPPAFALALTRRDAWFIAGLAAVHLAINVSMWQLFEGGIDIGHKHGYMLVAAAPAMFLLLAYLAFEPELKRWSERGRPAEAAVSRTSPPAPSLRQAQDVAPSDGEGVPKGGAEAAP